MKRRGFLGFLGGAAVAGPSMAQHAVAQGIEAMALPVLPFGGPEGYPTGGMGIDASGRPYDHAEWLRDRITQVMGISEEERRDRINGWNVVSLDPDLAVNRSFSLAAKVQMQKRRNFERSIASEHRSLVRELTEHLKRQVF